MLLSKDNGSNVNQMLVYFNNEQFTFLALNEYIILFGKGMLLYSVLNKMKYKNRPKFYNQINHQSELFPCKTQDLVCNVQTPKTASNAFQVRAVDRGIHLIIYEQFKK